MPIYDYKCNRCGSAIEFHRGLGEDREPTCCQETMQRVFTAAPAIFNAPGFYSTDNRKK